MSANEERERAFEGRWYEYPLMRNALLSGLSTGTAFVLAHLKVFPPRWKDTRCAAAVACLLVVCLGFGGWTLCVRPDGRLLFKLKFSGCNDCVPCQMCPLNAGDTNGVDCGPIGRCSCGCVHGCREIHVATIPAARSSYSIEKSHREASPGPRLAVRKGSVVSLGRRLGEGNSPDPPKARSAVSSLRTTILII
jgi:hypothetical protein